MAGIGCREGASPLIVGNECERNEMAGIGLENKAAAVIRGNRCFDNISFFGLDRVDNLLRHHI